jgi:hypothetical protein
MNDEEFAESARRNVDDIERYLLRRALHRALAQGAFWLLVLAAAVAVLAWQWGIGATAIVVAAVAVPSGLFGWWSWHRRFRSDGARRP